MIILTAKHGTHTYEVKQAKKVKGVEQWLIQGSDPNIPPTWMPKDKALEFADVDWRYDEYLFEQVGRLALRLGEIENACDELHAAYSALNDIGAIMREAIKGGKEDGMETD